MSTPDLESTAGIMLMLAGLWLLMRRQSDTWKMEEAVKNGKLTADDVRRRMKWLTVRPVGLIAGGLVLVGYAAWKLRH